MSEKLSRGRKRCPSCGTVCGVRTRVCPNCNTEFVAKSKEEKRLNEITPSNDTLIKIAKANPPDQSWYDEPVKAQNGYAIGPSTLVVYAPSGNCPHRLTGVDFETVHQWATDVRDTGHKKDEFYTWHALKYFVRHFYDVHSDDYREVCECLKECERQEAYVPADESVE